MENQEVERSENFLARSYRDREAAEHYYNRLRERGYTDDNIDIIMSDDTRKKYFSNSGEYLSGFGNKALEGAGTGSAIGSAVGAAVGIIAAIGTSLIIPGLGIVVAGPLAAGLAGAGAGGVTGGIIGALIGFGIPEDKAKIYEQDIKNGNIVIGVHLRSDDVSDLEDYWHNDKTEEIRKQQARSNQG